MNTFVSDLEQLIGVPVTDIVPLGGGSINQVYRITNNSEYYCIKINLSAPEDFFQSEKLGLETLAASNSIRTPSVIDSGTQHLMLEWIDQDRQSRDQEVRLGRQLATLHNTTSNSFGFTSNNYCGATPQINTQCKNGFEFFALHRIQNQVSLAITKSLLDQNEVKLIDSLIQKIDAFIPAQPASLSHGDLWNGNVVFSGDGPVLIDPAVHYGWAEADLAMTRLFGGFNKYFYDSYHEVRPLEPGFEERAPLYNLYHLLNHLNLFGQGWHSAVMDTVQRFTFK
ncbi:MAG: fructosamine kinase family protein [bacterium]